MDLNKKHFIFLVVGVASTELETFYLRPDKWRAFQAEWIWVMKQESATTPLDLDHFQTFQSSVWCSIYSLHNSHSNPSQIVLLL